MRIPPWMYWSKCDKYHTWHGEPEPYKNAIHMTDCVIMIYIILVTSEWQQVRFKYAKQMNV